MGWAPWFSVSGGRAAARSPISCIARNPDHLDLFVTGTDGGIYSTWWDAVVRLGGLVQRLRRPRGARVTDHLCREEPEPPGPVRRRHGRRDLLDVVGRCVRLGGLVPGLRWPRGPGLPGGGGRAQPEPPGPVRHGHRRRHLLDLVGRRVRLGGLVPGLRWPRGARVAGHGHCPQPEPPRPVRRRATDGGIYSTWWDAASGWAGWFPVSGGRAHSGAPITAIARNPNHLDLFVTGTDGRIYSTWWDAASGWAGWFNVSGGAAAPRSRINVVARNPNHLDLFVTGTDGRIYSTWWDAASGWAGWFNVSGGAAALASPIDVVSRYPDHLDLFVTGTDGGIYSTWWHQTEALRVHVKLLTEPTSFTRAQMIQSMQDVYRAAGIDVVIASDGDTQPSAAHRSRCRCLHHGFDHRRAEPAVREPQQRGCRRPVRVLRSLDGAAAERVRRPPGHAVERGRDVGGITVDARLTSAGTCSASGTSHQPTG